MLSMFIDGQSAVYFYDKDRPDQVYCYSRYTGEKHKARIILDKKKIMDEVGKECYEKYHHEYLLTDLKEVKHLPREFMNYIRRKSKLIKKDYIYALGY